jgi:hypothetical protein
MNESKKKQGKKEKALLKSPSKPAQCTFGRERLKEMKDDKIEFFAGDAYKRLRIIEIDDKTRSIHLVCELGKITWPLSYKKMRSTAGSRRYFGRLKALRFRTVLNLTAS